MVPISLSYTTPLSSNGFTRVSACLGPDGSRTTSRTVTALKHVFVKWARSWGSESHNSENCSLPLSSQQNSCTNQIDKGISRS
jgi:hypothetical protein